MHKDRPQTLTSQIYEQQATVPVKQLEATQWQTIIKLITWIDQYLIYFKLFDQVKVALYITKLWAMFGLYISKLFMLFFKIILSIPDNWLNIPANLVKTVKNTEGKLVHIASAIADNKIITNKLKIFLRFYWELASEDTSFNTNGFDFYKLRQVLNCSVLYCYYLLSDDTNDIKEFFKNIGNINSTKIEFKDNNYTRIRGHEASAKKLLFRHVDFESDEYIEAADRIFNNPVLNDLYNLIKSPLANTNDEGVGVGTSGVGTSGVGTSVVGTSEVGTSKVGTSEVDENLASDLASDLDS